ncbi:MAG TPA: CBS domain-containing protein [Xanthobacteraceae bacterium]|jgi:CBS domain-containing protein|uniref:CBS domain-containing protein n=1 Tax=Roseixanthobacter finlandensis TaxID=3119922 RepID=UPI000BCCD37F|nr:MAG: inosine-5-monophosphate dehydrogenase [Rhizobiales bacterium 39-66-18]HQS10687.1 CBS domain-containing protein [Xanthobacteraceae bacterium]HQS49411.1 CBS domain-containing protein [Xanthobacteraceae bacterium]
MTVGIILQRKTSGLVTISPEASLTQAVQSLSQNRIGAIVATGPDGNLEGILSERDVVRILGERGPDVLSQPVSSVMTRAVVTCTADETVPAIMERMTRGRFRHVPVVSGSKLVGIISIGDVVKYRVEEMERESAELRDYIMTA